MLRVLPPPQPLPQFLLVLLELNKQNYIYYQKRNCLAIHPPFVFHLV